MWYQCVNIMSAASASSAASSSSTASTVSTPPPRVGDKRIAKDSDDDVGKPSPSKRIKSSAAKTASTPADIPCKGFECKRILTTDQVHRRCRHCSDAFCVSCVAVGDTFTELCRLCLIKAITAYSPATMECLEAAENGDAIQQRLYTRALAEQESLFLR